MRQLIFLCSTNAVRSQMAAQFARAIAPDNVTVLSAGMEPAAEIHPLAAEVMAEAGFPLDDQAPSPLSDVDIFNIDVAVTLCSLKQNKCEFALPGYPCRVHWDLEDPTLAAGDRETQLAAFRSSRDEIRHLVDELFTRGYFDSLCMTNSQNNLLIDNLQEGLIAHDMNRTITYFNRAAETLTGYHRDEVVGRDCHDVLHKFCGEQKCSFCAENKPNFDRLTYPVTFKTKTGQTIKVEMSINAIKNQAGDMTGILATFRDLTYENYLAGIFGKTKQYSGIVGRDKKMLEVFDLIRSVSDANASVLIQGESGTGKELVASAIHNESPRAQNLFVPVNCGALPETLLESELFGHVRGAFTGATREKKGRFELAHGGTIFLDEIGDISPAMQVKLLRVLQEGAFERLGDTTTIRSDFRLICATNKDLTEEIQAGRFREDLFYRICVVPINLPPLRERPSDIPLLVEHVLSQLKVEMRRDTVTLSSNALDILLAYQWPGNIRELQNTLQFALVKCREPRIEVMHLPPHIINSVEQANFSRTSLRAHTAMRGRKKKLTDGAVRQALHEAKGNKAEAARILGVGRATLYRFLNEESDKKADHDGQP